MWQEENLQAPFLTLTARDLDLIQDRLGDVIQRTYEDLLKEVPPSEGVEGETAEEWTKTVAAHFYRNRQRLARFRYAIGTQSSTIEDDSWKDLMRRVDPRDVRRFAISVSDPKTQVDVNLVLTGTSPTSSVRIASSSASDLDRYRGFFADLFEKRRAAVRDRIATGWTSLAWRLLLGAIPGALLGFRVSAQPQLAFALGLLGSLLLGSLSYSLTSLLLERTAARVVVIGYGPSPEPGRYLIEFALAVAAGVVISLIALLLPAWT